MNRDDALNLARHHIAIHCPNFTVSIVSGSQTTLGWCSYGTASIGLMDWFIDLNEEDIVLDTILHEIAHALTPHDKGHGLFWINKCHDLGCGPHRYARYDDWPDAVLAAPTANFIAQCGECGARFGRRQDISGAHCNCMNGYHPKKTVLIFEANPNAKSKSVRVDAPIERPNERARRLGLAARLKRLNKPSS